MKVSEKMKTSGCVKAFVTEPGDDYENLAETYVIFITENDVLKAGLTDAKDMHYKILADRVRYFKEDAKGVEAMCKAMEDMRKEAVAEDRLKTLRNLMKNLGLTAEQALVAMGVSESDKGILIKKL